MRVRWIAGVLMMGGMAGMATGASGQGTGGSLLVVEKGGHSLAIVDAVSGKVTASVAEGGVTGHEVAASRDGRIAFVPIYGNSGVGKPGTDGSEMVAIDVAAGKVVGRLDFGHGVRPHCAVLGPDGLLYVTTELDKTISIVDVSNPKAMKIVGTIPTGAEESHMLAISADGKRGYTANVGPGTVSVLDIPGRKLIRVVKVSGSVQRISVSRDGQRVFTADQTKPLMMILDGQTGDVSGKVPMTSSGYGSASTLDGRWLLVALIAENKVAVIDLKSLQVARTIDVPAAPQAVLMRPDGKTAYVSCDSSNQVAEIDLGSWKVSRLIATGKLADGMAWAAAH